MSCAETYTPQLRARGYRMTPQRLAILHVLHHSGEHLSPAEVFEAAKKTLPSLTEPTVYRTLEFLTENGFVRPSQRANGHVNYEIAGRDHHHLVCRNCGGEMEVEHSLLRDMYKKIETASGYKLTDSHLTFFGLCPNCK